jgi:H-type lectin domain
MKRIYSSVTGIDQGSAALFSDFEHGGEMWTGKGPRSSSVPVLFSEPFKLVPAVFVSLEMWDMDSKTNQRAEITAENIELVGFDLMFKTWGDTKIARARAAWMAIGEVMGEDDWDV